MNSICDIEFSEYAGQYTTDYAGAISGCHCGDCRRMRERYDKAHNDYKEDDAKDS